MSEDFYDDISGNTTKLDLVVSGLEKIVAAIIESSSSMPNETDILDFGICTGNGTLATLRTLELSSISYRKCWGFDSLLGLPAESKNVSVPDNWHEGAFSISSITGKTVDGAGEYLRNKLSRFDFELVAGFYSDTLTPDLAKKMLPAKYISIDVDLYISSVQVHKFIVENKLIIPGTIVRYDDWGGEGGFSGEHRAHLEMCEEYGINFETLDYSNGVKIMRNI